MNTGDVRIQDCPYPSLPTIQLNTKAGNTALNSGEVVKLDIGGSGIQYAKLIADGDGSQAQIIAGIVKGGPNKNAADSVTAAADGLVDVYIPLPGVIYAAKANAGFANTTAKILALLGKRVKFDVTAGVITVDSNGDADNVANGVRIVGGNPATNELYFQLSACVTYIGNDIT